MVKRKFEKRKQQLSTLRTDVHLDRSSSPLPADVQLALPAESFWVYLACVTCCHAQISLDPTTSACVRCSPFLATGVFVALGIMVGIHAVPTEHELLDLLVLRLIQLGAPKAME